MFNANCQWDETDVKLRVIPVRVSECILVTEDPREHPPRATNVIYPDKARDAERLEHQLAATHDILDALRQENEDLKREVATHRAWNKAVNAALGQAERENADMHAMLPETPDYHGPTKDGKSVADSVHERVHEVVKDVLAERVIPAARKQLQGALDKAPKDAVAGPDFTRDFGKDPRRLGMA